METLLSQTPFDPPTVLDYEEVIDAYGQAQFELSDDFNPMLLGLAIRTAYDAIDPVENSDAIHEGNLIWQFEDWVVYVGTELIYHNIEGTATDAFPEPLRAELVGAGASMAAQPITYSFFEHEFAALSLS
ncbi:hypothetical protein [Haloarcula sp. Atlit-47R]|uniref:hypothetical protein n=1 Tax=Haloarcula sp. Atlit-47R TaxID=2282132 RepID=UPI0011C3A3D3|nr:hypothetical protein [Haloarcula sp. Atlit-47R]